MVQNRINDFLKNLINIFDENVSYSIFQNAEFDEQKFEAAAGVLSLLHARCGINVDEELEAILSHPRYRKTVNLKTLIEDIVDMVDDCCGCFNPYVNHNMSPADLRQSCIIHHPDPDYLRCKLRAGKKQYVLCTLELIQRQMSETEIHMICGDTNIEEILEVIKRERTEKKSDQEQTESSERIEKPTTVDSAADDDTKTEDKENKEDKTQSYIYRVLRTRSRSNFVSVLLSSEQMRQDYIKNKKHFPYEYVMATKAVRIAGVLARNNIFNEEQEISYKKYRGFVVRYHKGLQETWNKFNESEDEFVKRTDRYLSEMLYGFELADYLLRVVRTKRIQNENMAESFGNITAQLMQIPDLSARKLYAEMLMSVLLETTDKNKRMEIWMRSDLFIKFESKVYYPILMTCVLESLCLLKKRKGYDVSAELKKAKASYRFDDYFAEDAIMDDKAYPFIKSPCADDVLQGFYTTLKEDYYNKEGFAASIGQKCYDIHLTPQQMLIGMQYVLCSGKTIDPASKIEFPSIPQDEYYIAKDGTPTGPFELRKLKQMLKHGTIQKDTFLFKKGTDNWKRAEQFEELAKAFEKLVPPMPQDIV